jgi:Ceramidase
VSEHKQQTVDSGYTAQMMQVRMINSRRTLGLLVLMLASLFGLFLLPPIAQNQNYHDFADQRTLFGIPNFWNVISNIPFIGIGAVGLWQFGRSQATMLLFLGIFLTGFGSAYYHVEPSDQTLFWDRLPMAIGFMAIFAIVVEERVDQRVGAFLLWPMTAIGVFSLLLWRWTGDLRLYAWVQFFPCLALPFIFLLFAPRFSGTIYWLIAAILYGLAKLFEFYDSAIYSAGVILSGHTLKHIAAAAACGALLRYFQKRQPIAVPNAAHY